MLEWVRDEMLDDGLISARGLRRDARARRAGARRSSSSCRGTRRVSPRARREHRGGRRRIREDLRLEPRVGVVLGSGLGESRGRARGPRSRFPTQRSRAGRCRRPSVTRASSCSGPSTGVPVAVMRGRAHLYEGIGADRVVFGVRVLGRLGIRSLVVTNAAGGINTGLPAGTARPHLRPRQPAGHIGARRAERRLARAALPGHERRLRPGVARASA